jgi:hypothetical protein
MPEPPVAQPATEEVSVAEAAAFAKAVLSEPEPPPDPSAPTEQEPSAAASAGPTPVATGDDRAAQRARLMAEYEAMRRSAEKEMRQRWQGMSRPAMPYGVPWVPGYHPQPYPLPPPYWPPR